MSGGNGGKTPTGQIEGAHRGEADYHLPGDHELLGDLLVRQVSGQQPQHLDLARGQTGRPFAAASDPVTGRADHR
jgi:hypothetical protein